MILALVAALAAAFEVQFVESHLLYQDEFVDYHAEDVNRDSRFDIIVMTKDDQGQRFLNIHYQSAQGSFPPKADVRIKIKKDILGYAPANVRAEEGLEFLFLTRTGAFSYSPTLPDYRDNVRKIADVDLLFDTPHSERLPRWPYVHRNEPYDEFLLVGLNTYHHIRPDGSDALAPMSTIEGFSIHAPVREQVAEVNVGFLRVGITNNAVRFVTARDRTLDSDRPRALLASRYSQQAPLWTDVNGDSRDDLILLDEREIFVFLARENGTLPQAPTRKEILPSSFEETSSVSAMDLNGDRRADIMIMTGEDDSDQEDRSIHIYRAEKDRLFGDAPAQVLKFDVLGLSREVIDVDGDGILDLVVSTTDAPMGPGALAGGLKIERRLLVYRGLGDATFERKPSLKRIKEYAPEEIASLIIEQSLEGDFDGDGLKDLIELDREEAVAIYPIRKDGSELTFQSDPSQRYQPRIRTRQLLVTELNDDPVTDLIVKLRDELVIFVSATTH